MFKNIFKNGLILFSRRQTNILSAAMVIMLTYAASMILGIFRERLLVSYFFACCRSSLDAYYAAFRLPDLVFQIVAIGALSAAFLPVFSNLLVKDEQEAYRLASAVINYLLLFFLCLSAVIFALARPLSEVITGFFSPSQVILMARMTRLMLVAQGLFLISNFLSAIIQSHQRFLIPALSPVFYNLGIIVAIILLAPSLGIWAPAVGVVLGAFFHLVLQIPLALRLGLSYRPIFDRKIAGVSEVFRLMLPRTLALAVYQIEATVTVFLATSLATGSLTIFYLAQRLMDLPVRLFGTPIGQAALPTLSSQKAKEDLGSFKNTLMASLNQILYLSLPAMALILTLRVPLVRLAYGAKTFPWQATLLTAKTVGIFSLAISSQAVIQLLVRGFYALHDTRSPFLIGSFSVILSVALAVYLTFGQGWGILGLAAATSITSLLQALLLLFLLLKRLSGIEVALVKGWLKMGLAAGSMALFLWLPMRLLDRFVLDTTRTIHLLALTLLASLVGFFVYLILSFLLAIPEVFALGQLVGRLGKWRQVLGESEEMIAPK
jgi:putative peptidoglycan lipid II flippase